MSKSLKILTFCASFVLLLSSCNSFNDNNTSFTYDGPTSSLNNDFVFNIDFSNKTTIDEYLSNCDFSNKNSAISGLLNILNSNDLYSNESIVTIVNKDLYDYGQDDDYENNIPNLNAGNYEIVSTYNLKRNNESYSVQGNLTYNETRVIFNNQENIEEVNSISINDGLYAVTIDSQNFLINENFDYGNEELNQSYSYYLTEYNLYSVLNLTKSQQFYEFYEEIRQSAFYETKTESVSFNKDNRIAELKINASKEFIIDDTQTIIYSAGVIFNINQGIISEIELFENVDAKYINQNQNVVVKPLKVFNITNKLSHF